MQRLQCKELSKCHQIEEEVPPRFDEGDKGLVNEKYTMYEQQHVLTLDVLKQWLNNEETRASYSLISFRGIFSEMGFRYHAIEKASPDGILKITKLTDKTNHE